jgi:hypothetical protein
VTSRAPGFASNPEPGTPAPGSAGLFRSPFFRAARRLAPLIERILLGILLLAFVVKGFIPAWSHLDSDFPNYYLAARLYHQGYPADRYYDWIWFQRQKDHAGIDRPVVTFIPHTFLSALLLVPLSSLPPLQAKHAWLLVNLLCLGLTALLMKRCTSLPWRRIGLLIFLAFIPLRANFLLGQMHVLVLFLLAVAAWLSFEDWLFLSGVAIAAAAAVKIYPALFILFFLVKKQWRAAAGLVIGLAAAGLASLYAFGLDACRVFAREVLPRALGGETFDPYNIAWNSFTALLRRLLISEPELNPSPVAHLPALYAFLHPLIHAFLLVAFLWALYRETEDRSTRMLEWGSYLFLLLWLSSQPALYHFVALILTAALVTDYLVERKQAAIAGIFVGLYVLALGPYSRLYRISPTGWRSLLFFPRLFILTLLGILLLWILLRRSPESLRDGLHARSIRVAALAFVALVVGLSISNLLHLRGQFDNYQARVAMLPAAAMQAEPAVGAQDLFFTTLVPDPGSFAYRYKLERLSGSSVSSVAGDWFHPAPGGASVWAEIASTTSRIVRFPTADFAAEASSLAVAAENAEQPVVSADGKILAFTREMTGRGSLWVQSIGEMPSRPDVPAGRELAGPEYDVRDAAFFPDHRVLFSAKLAGRFRLYIADPETGVIRETNAPTCSARYPAISRDGSRVAFSCEHKGAWQVHILNLRTGEDVQLTHADCNSITPVWSRDEKDLIYATDCGRGLGLTALARLRVP